MKNFKLILFLLCLLIWSDFAYGWRIEGPTVACPGKPALYKFYPEGGRICYIRGDAFLNGAGVDSQRWSNNWTIPITVVEFYVTWPMNSTGIGEIKFFGDGCHSLDIGWSETATDINASLMVNVGAYPKLSLQPPTLCNSTGTVTVSADTGECKNTYYDWTAPQGWVFTSNNSNIIKDGPPVVTMKPTGAIASGAYSVSATAIYPGGLRSKGGYASVLFYGSDPPVTTINGPSSVCTNSPNANYSFYDNDPYLSKEWSLTYDANPKGYIIGSTYNADLYVDIINSASAGSFTVNLKRTNQCGRSSVSSRTTTVSSAPPSAAPAGVYGPGTVCNSGGNSYYNIGTMASGLEYSVQPASAVASSNTGPYGTYEVDWVNTFTGTATIQVRSVNPCGAGPWSPVKYVNVVNGTCSNRTSELPSSDESQPSAELNVSLFPNPAAESAILHISNSFETETSVQISDTKGNIVFERINAGPEAELLIGENLDAGIYIVKVSDGLNEKNIKFVKQ
jgi:hypothetical protein